MSVEKDEISVEEVVESIVDKYINTFKNKKITGKTIHHETNNRKYGKLKFERCEFIYLSKFRLDQLNITEFYDCDFYCKNLLFLDYENCSKINFEKCRFHGNVKFQNIQLKKNIEISNCEFHESVSFEDVNSIKFTNGFEIGFKRAIEIKDIEFSNCDLIDLQYLKVNDVDFKSEKPSKITINGGQFNDIDFFLCQISNLIIQGGEKKIQINKLRFLYSNIEDEVNLFRLNINKFELSNQNVSNGFFSFRHCNINTEFKSFNIDFSNHKWLDISFNKQAQVTFTGSHILGLVCSNVTWPHKNLLNNEEHDSFLSLEEFHKDNREQYRQLKHLSKNYSDNVNALAFYRNEMIEYRKYVKLTKEISRRDRFLIWVDHRVSDFGQNWIRPFVLMLLTPLIFYQFIALIDYSLNEIQYLGENCENYWKGMATFMNPAHKLPETFNFGMILIDFLSRALTGFFIYHFIRATRRYGKI